MNALRAIYLCAKHQDVDSEIVSANPNPSETYYLRAVQDDAWIASRAREQEMLPEPEHTS